MTHLKRPKVLILVTVASTARLFMRGYVEYLASQGYEVVLAAEGLGNFQNEFDFPNVRICSVPLTRDPNLKHDLMALASIYRLVRDTRPDILIYATPKASLLGSIAGTLGRVPVRIYHLWGIRFETMRGPKRFILKMFERACAALSTTVVANSASLAEKASELGIANRSRIKVPGKGSSHGVDSDRFSPDVDLPPVDAATASFLDTNPGFTIGYVGRLHADKGIDILLEAADRLATSGEKIKVLLVGGDEGVQTDISTQSFHFPLLRTGQVSDVRPYISRIDVLVLMSLREGFPNVVLEAAAMTVPAIVSNATGCKDAVSDGKTGLIVPIGDVERLCHALKTMIYNPSWNRRMGVEARRRAITEFNPRDVWSDTEAIVREHIR